MESHSWRGVLNTNLCDQVCQHLAAGRWFSPGTPASSTSKADGHVITEILLKVVLNTINLNQSIKLGIYMCGELYILNLEDQRFNTSVGGSKNVDCFSLFIIYKTLIFSRQYKIPVYRIYIVNKLIVNKSSINVIY